MKINTVIPNPLDELFNTRPMDGDLQDEYAETSEGQLAVATVQDPAEKDEEDHAIDSKIDEVYDAAINAFNQQTAYTEVIEPRYAARNAEVAAGYLTIALNAVATRAKVKGDRKKTAQFVPFTGRKDGAVVASREDIMKMIAIDAEMKQL